MRNELKAAEDSIIVGHSSGAAAAMRFCEQYKVSGKYSEITFPTIPAMFIYLVPNTCVSVYGFGALIERFCKWDY